MDTPSLFDPVRLGDIELANRIVMAPMTRSRVAEGDAPNALNVEYYRQRASAGLIVSEGTYPSPTGKGYCRTPGICTPQQIAGWRNVADAVHREGGKIVLQLMHCGRVGAIVNTASMMAFKASPGTPAYTAAKAGVVALTKVIAGEYADRGIRCNAVAPGIVATAINTDILAKEEVRERLLASIPQGRIGDASELAEAVVWLCSPAASYVNGACLPVDGGVLVR